MHTRRLRSRGRRGRPHPSARQWLVPIVVLTLGLVVLTGIASQRRPPPPADDLCRVFAERPSWFLAARRTAREWEISEPLQMAFIQQESGFRAWARPSRRQTWWLLPGRRPSTAFGFAQALDGTWDEYRRSRQRAAARRDLFEDVADFLGWHLHRLHLELGLDESDARSLYLAYHEGARGYRERRFAEKPEVMRAATRVAALTRAYEEQYAACAPALSRRHLITLAGRIVLAAAILALLAWGVYLQHQKLRRSTERR